MGPGYDGESDLYRAVVAYLEENPDAMDTLEGIADWWVAKARTRPSVGAVTRVVQRLVDEGRLEEVGGLEQPRFRRRRSGLTGDHAARYPR